MRTRAIPSRSRRGTVYVFVLALAMIVLTIAVGSISIVRAQSRTTTDQSDAGEAQHYALSAIELGRLMIANDANWRTTRSNGNWFTKQTIGQGSCTLNVVNPNGALNNSAFDPIVMTGTGFKGNASHTVKTTLLPSAQPVTCLKSAVFANQNASFSSATVQSNTVIASNASVSATSSLITAAVEAAGSITGGNFLGLNSGSQPPRSVPDSTVFDWYIANGASVNFNNIPKLGGIATIDRRVFSPANNPFPGSTNAQGLYVINCAGSQIIIQNSRIYGTLVVLNAGANSVIQGAMVCSPFVANYPTLLVQGNFKISITGSLVESGTPSVNFNPAGAPYNGATDSDTTDSYTTELQGLVYISGSLSTTTNLVVNGVLVCGGTLSTSSNLTTTYSNVFANNPPPGFGQAPKLLPMSGTWLQSVN